MNIDLESQHNLDSLNNALKRGLNPTANRIMNSGVQPDVNSLNYALDSGLEATANRILDSGVQPDMYSLNSALYERFRSNC